MFFKKDRRQAPEVNAGSMADIAFLLLIFFLVTTTIMADNGLLVKLPPWVDEPPTDQANARNILQVSINAADQLLVEGDLLTVEELRAQTKLFIMNPAGSLALAESPDVAIISVINDRSTSYDMYLRVYNELKAAYNELWDEEADLRYGVAFAQLPISKQREIRTYIPLVISEAEPVDLGG